MTPRVQTIAAWADETLKPYNDAVQRALATMATPRTGPRCACGRMAGYHHWANGDAMCCRCHADIAVYQTTDRDPAYAAEVLDCCRAARHQVGDE